MEKINTFDARVLDFNPKRMEIEEAHSLGIPQELQPLLADKRQYPIKIAKLFPKGITWFEPNNPWFFRLALSDKDRVQSLSESETLILSGSGLSAFKFQENDASAFSPEDYKHLETTQEIIKEHLGKGKWILGICFGGQLAIQAVGGKIGRLPNNSRGYSVTEAGWLEHELTSAGKNDEVFGNLPDRFFAPHFHNDFVSQLPQINSEVITQSGNIRITDAQILAIRRGFLDSDGIRNKDKEYIQASVIIFDNGARLYQIQPHPEMSTSVNANFLVRQNEWIINEMGRDYYNQALQVPPDADFSASSIITRFVNAARDHDEAAKGIRYPRHVEGQKVSQFTPYLLE
jgi:GMP synthase-like glutamine amidotransferase